ncbi:MAG: hypothetical protein ABH845_03030, partial [Candidatus Omnitrophota bacterium]
MSPPKFLLSPWLRPVTIVTAVAFLWTTVASDAALAFPSPNTSHLRPGALSAQDGAVKEMRTLLAVPSTEELPLSASLGNTSPSVVRKMAHRIQRGLVYALLCLYLSACFVATALPAPAPGAPPVASSPAGEVKESPINLNWISWKGKIPEEARSDAETQTASLAQDLESSIAAYRAAARELAEAEKAYLQSFAPYLDAYGKWRTSNTAVREGYDTRIFDEAMQRTTILLRDFLDARLRAIDKLIELSMIPSFARSSFSIPQRAVAGGSHTVTVRAFNDGYAPAPVGLVTVYSVEDTEGGRREVQTFESKRVVVPAKGEVVLSTVYERIPANFYSVSAFLIDTDRIPPLDERFGVSLSGPSATWVYTKEYEGVTVSPPGASSTAPLETASQKVSVPADRIEQLAQELLALEEGANRAAGELEQYLHGLPDAQRTILDGMFAHLRDDLNFSDAEEALLPLADAVRDKAAVLEAARAKLSSQYDAIRALWKDLIRQQDWTEDEKAQASFGLHQWMAEAGILGEGGAIAKEKPSQTAVATVAGLAEERASQR